MKTGFLKDRLCIKRTLRVNVINLCEGVNEFKKGYHTRSSLVKDERVVCLQFPTVF